MTTRASELPLLINLSETEAAKLASGVAVLTQAGLPLPAGLRALAEELPDRRLRTELNEMAARLERGDSLEVVLNSASKSLPLHLAGLLVAGLRSGRLPEVMEEYLQVEQQRRQLRERLQTNFAYLTLLSLAVTAFAFFIQLYFLKELGELIGQLNRGSFLGVFSYTTWKLFGQVAWLSAGFSLFLLLMPLALSELPGMAWLAPLFDHLPFLGPLLRNLRLASFARVMALLLENGTPLPDAFSVAGTAAGDVLLARDCRRVAAELEAGRPLAESLTEHWRFPRNWIPLVEWGEHAHAPVETFRIAAQMHDVRAINQSTLINTVFAPLMFLLIAGIVCLAGSVVVMPTIASIESLIFSFAWRRGPSPQIAIPAGFGFSSMFSPMLLGVSLLLSKRLVTLRHDPTNENLIEMGLSMAGWTLIAVGVLGNLMLMMGFLAFAWIPILAVIWEFIDRKRIRTQQQALLWTMAVSAERFIPLVPAIEAFAEDIRGKFGVRLVRMANLLKNGVALPDALRQVKRVLPRQLIPIIRVGYESGALARGLTEAAAAEDRQQALWGAFSAKMLYVAALPCIGCGIVIFMLVTVVPSYQRLFKDFGTSLPSMTQMLMDTSSFAAAFWPWVYAAATVFGLLFLYGVLRYLGVPLFDLPGVSRMLRREHASAIMDNLALAVEQGRPMDGTIRTLAECYPKKSIRRRLEDVLYDIEHGDSWCVSMYRRGLLRQSDLAVLQSAERAGNLSWALRETAASNRRRLVYRLNVLVQLLFPPAVIAFGAAVLFIVVAMFMPLMALIYSMSKG